MASKTDKAVFIVTGTTLLTFLITHRIGNIWMLYPNVLIAVALFFYCIGQIDEDVSCFSSSSVFGITMVLTYVPMDWLFSRKAGLIFYLRSDFLPNITTPIGIILNWIVFAVLGAYCYQRLVEIFQARWTVESNDSRIGLIGIRVMAAGATSIVAAVGSTVIYGLGASHLWVWNATQIDGMPQIATVPAFVPVSFLCTFLLCPYFFGMTRSASETTEGQAGVAGIRCGIFMGAFQFFSFLLFYVWK